MVPENLFGTSDGENISLKNSNEADENKYILDWFCGDKMQGDGYLKNKKTETRYFDFININNHNDKE